MKFFVSAEHNSELRLEPRLIRRAQNQQGKDPGRQRGREGTLAGRGTGKDVTQQRVLTQTRVGKIAQAGLDGALSNLV